MKKTNNFIEDMVPGFDWQIGFGRPQRTGSYGLGQKYHIQPPYSFLGLGEGKAENKDIEQKYQEWKTHFGAPSSCTQVQQTIPRIRSLLDSKTTEAGGIDSSAKYSPNITGLLTGIVAPGTLFSNKAKKAQKDIQRDIGGLNKLLDEYVNYYNLNCITAENTGQPEGTFLSSTTGSPPADTANIVASGSPAAPGASATDQKIPLWVWLLGAGAVLGAVLLMSGKAKPAA